LSAYVLSPVLKRGKFAQEASFGISTAVEAVEGILREGTDWAMSKYNKKVPLN